MIIAFIVLAIAALIFLFVYNSRMTKKSAQKHTAQQVQDNPQSHNNAVPAQQPEVPRQQPEAPTHQPEVNPVAVAAKPVGSPSPITETKPLPHSYVQEDNSDQAYREALRKFAGQSAKAEENTPAAGQEGNPDDLYREALRAMARDKKE